MKKTKFKAVIEYIGHRYSGMQKQEYIKNTIQEKVEEAIYKLTQEKVEINYAGRTDSGVSAMGQVIDFEIQNERINENNILFGLNSLLKNEDISIKEVSTVDSSFNSRFDAKLRTYRYFVSLEKTRSVHKKLTHYHFPFELNLNKIILASKILEGKHDFTSFCKSDDSNIQNPIRTISSIEIIQNNDELIFEISAKSFLHNMIRIIVGTLLEVGIERINIENIQKIIEARDRKLAGKTVPAHGLFFFRVDY